MRRLSPLALIAAVALLAVGLMTPGAGAQAPGTTVNVVLSEWIVKPTPKSVPAGTVTFVVKNKGGTKHEMVIVKGDDPKALPKKANGSVNEAKIPAADIIGEIANVKSKKTKTATFQLSAGTYILVCNIVDPVEDSGHLRSAFHDDEPEKKKEEKEDEEHGHGEHDPSHFRNKMFTVFTVT